MSFQIQRSIWVRSQLYRIMIKVNPGQNWELEGIPADFPSEEDEIVSSQTLLFKEYEKYGLYEVNIIDQVMGKIDQAVGSFLNSRRNRQPWKHAGIYDELGRPKEMSSTE